LSQDLERVYTINLGKVLLSPDNQRAKRAINMIKEFTSHHMKTEQIKIEEELSHRIWKRGIRSPPRKIRVLMTKTDEGFILVSLYDEEIESKVKSKEEEKSKAKKVIEKETVDVETTEKPTPELEPEATELEPEAKPAKKPEAKPAKKPEAKPAKKPEAKPAKKPEAKPAKKPEKKSKK